MKKKIGINCYRQTHNMSCGAATALMLLNAFGLAELTKENEDWIYDVLKDGKEHGSNVSALVKLLRAKGINAVLNNVVTMKDIFVMTLSIIVNALLFVLTMKRIFKDNVMSLIDILSTEKSDEKISYRNEIINNHYIAVITEIHDSKSKIRGFHWNIIVGFNDDDKSYSVVDPYYGRKHISYDEMEKITDTLQGRVSVIV